MVRVVQIRSWGRQGPIYPTWSLVSTMAADDLAKSPGHQQLQNIPAAPLLCNRKVILLTAFSPLKKAFQIDSFGERWSARKLWYSILFCDNVILSFLCMCVWQILFPPLWSSVIIVINVLFVFCTKLASQIIGFMVSCEFHIQKEIHGKHEG